MISEDVFSIGVELEVYHSILLQTKKLERCWVEGKNKISHFVTTDSAIVVLTGTSQL